MAGLNDCNFIGYVGQDPETRYVGEGVAKVNFSLGVTRKWKDAGGNPKEATTWVAIEAWRGLAEFVSKYVHKGHLLFVKGEFRLDDYESKSGEKKRFAKFIASDIQFLERKGDSAEPHHREKAKPSEQPSTQFNDEKPSGGRPAAKPADDYEDEELGPPLDYEDENFLSPN